QLGLEEVGIHENFFELGGDSLHGIQIQHDLVEEFDREIPLELIFEASTIGELAAHLGEEEYFGVEPIKRHEYRDEGPVSAEQRRLWMVQQMYPDSVAYHVSRVARLRGDLD
ncbi:MAG: phosphopantetheine-binding protein, partial [Bradymonadaceae bacterium]